MELKKTLYRLIAENTTNGFENETMIDDATRLIEDLQYDSGDIVALIVAIEETFGVEFKDSELLSDKFNVVGDLVECVEMMLA